MQKINKGTDIAIIIVAVTFLISVLMICALVDVDNGGDLTTTESMISDTYCETSSESDESTEPDIVIGTIEEAAVTGTPAPYIEELIDLCTTDN